MSPKNIKQDNAKINDVPIPKLTKKNPLYIDIMPSSDEENMLHIKLFSLLEPPPLSTILKVLENMGLTTFSHIPGKTQDKKNNTLHINDFIGQLNFQSNFEASEIADAFKKVFLNTLSGVCENDHLNTLLFVAGLSYQQIVILRAYTKYLNQINFRYSQQFIESTLANHPNLTADLMTLFSKRFQLKQTKALKKEYNDINEKIQKQLEKITRFDEDCVIQQFWALIKATIRTNAFQIDEKTHPKPYLAFKILSERVPNMLVDRPKFEIFVYSSRFEGIHLRSDKIARGGLRWSDRLEDYRTEILGLMKAQKVKNTVIVPAGAKGGFILKDLKADASADSVKKEVVACYQLFISALLDLTDNLVKKKIVPPTQITCHDEPDPYLVVAADKGTATFSDIANQVASDYQFWLGDAFASGGSAGFDHKKMGITARGAWESIKRHFYELGINIHQDDFTVIGIGDMSGDVFGNGMLYSRKIKLVAAFDHRHIFIDPNPDPATAYKERSRLFKLSRSSWDDYNKDLISKGGGVYSRSIKSIRLSKEAQEALSINQADISPNLLIQSLLKAPVDLLYNGGIGTYIKSSTESHADVGDKVNEDVRVDGADLRCKVVGEGGNLGLTQLGRIEFALRGGLVLTDFIDNSAGVDCSDHEVNIKILLNTEIEKGNLTLKRRNRLLGDMTEQVAELCLKNNYLQALAVSIAAIRESNPNILIANYINELTKVADLNQASEKLPDKQQLLDRKKSELPLTRPELCVLLSYSKMYISKSILDSNLPDDPYFTDIIYSAFPESLTKKYSKALAQHQLRREIIATQISNDIVNTMGITFCFRKQIELGNTIPEIAESYIIASRVFKTDRLKQIIYSLTDKIPTQTQYDLLQHIRQLLYLSTRWFLIHKQKSQQINTLVENYKGAIDKLLPIVPSLTSGVTRLFFDKAIDQFTKAGIRKSDASRIAMTRPLYALLNVVEVADKYDFDLKITAQVYYKVGSRFDLVWFRDFILTDKSEGYWNMFAKLTLRDDLDRLQKILAINILKQKQCPNKVNKMIDLWIDNNPKIMERWQYLLDKLHSSDEINYTMFFIATRELSELLNS